MLMPQLTLDMLTNKAPKTQATGNTSGSIFDQNEWDQTFPKGWGKSARETKSNYLMGQQNKLLSSGQTEANRITGEEEKRGQQMQDIISQGLTEANKPTMTEMDIRRAMTDKTDAVARSTNQSMALLRSQLGGAGVIGGGMAAGLASQIALQKAGQITDARRGLYLEASKSAALDRARNFQNQLTLANAVNRPVSTLNMDWIQSALGLNLAMQGNEAQRSAAKDAAAASKQAGLLQAGGALGGALIGAFA